MNFKLYVGVVVFVLAFLASVCLVAERYIQKSIDNGVKEQTALLVLERQNEALRQNALSQEQIHQHNANADAFYTTLAKKYTLIQAKNNSCEAKLEALKQKLKAFYENNKSRL